VTTACHTVADLYRYRWQVELFFKWIKQRLRIKSFFGTSENAVKSQIWIAISVYILVAIIKTSLQFVTLGFSGLATPKDRKQALRSRSGRSGKAGVPPSWRQIDAGKMPALR